VRLISSRSQRTSKCGNNISDTLDYALVIGFPEGGTPSWCGFHEGGPQADVGEYVDFTGTLHQISALVVGRNVKFLNALLSGRMWGLCFCSTERRLGTIDVGISNFKIPLCIYCL